MVYIVNDGRQIVACRSRNNNVLSACIDMSLSLSLRGVETSALQNNVNTDFAPRKLCCVSLSVDLDLFAINDDGIFACFNLISQCAICLGGIIFQCIEPASWEMSGR